MSTFSVRDAVVGDLPAVLAIEQESFSDPWSQASFNALFNVPSVYFAVLESDNGISGYGVMYVAADQSELANLAVARGARGAGCGGRLLRDLLRTGAQRGATEMWLEVRASNEPALALYKRFGFDEVGRRRRYYDRPVEDAVIMRCDRLKDPITSGRAITM